MNENLKLISTITWGVDTTPNKEIDRSQMTSIDNNTFTVPSHGLVANQVLTPLTNSSAFANIPNGLTRGTKYYVMADTLTADTFQLTTSSGGSTAVTLSSSGDASGWKLENTGTAQRITINNIGSLKKFRLQFIGRVGSNTNIGFNGITSGNAYLLSNGGSYAMTFQIITTAVNKGFAWIDCEMENGNFVGYGGQVATSTVNYGISAYNQVYTGLDSITFVSADIFNESKLEIYEWVSEQEINKCPIITAISNIYTLDLFKACNFNIETTDTNAKTIAFSNVPTTSGQIITATLQLKYTNQATITYPAGVTWKDGKSPALVQGKSYTIMFTSIDNGTTWQGAYVGAW